MSVEEVFTPIKALTSTHHAPTAPVAHDFLQLIFVRAGSAILFSEFGQRPASLGDVAVLGAHTLCGSEPEGHLTITTIRLDPDYMIDQVFWQHASVLSDRLHAQQVAESIYTQPAQLIRLGEDRAGMLMPWLDELTALSLDGPVAARFYRTQALLFAVLDVLIPYVATTPARITMSSHTRTIPSPPRRRRFIPLRAEAIQAHALLQASPAHPWTLRALAERVHLSPKQTSRVFIDAYGKTPLAYLTMIRVERMARLLRDEELTIAAAGNAVGWSSRSRAAEAFRQCIGLTPQQYRSRARSHR